MIASLFKKKHRFSLSRALGVTIALVGLMAQGCIGDEEGVDENGLAGPDGAESENQGSSIKVYVKDRRGDYNLVKLRPEPGADRSAGESPEGRESQGGLDRLGQAGTGTRSTAKVDAEYGGVDYELGGAIKPYMQLDRLPLWAADACMAEAEALGTLPKPFTSDRDESSTNEGYQNAALYRWAYTQFGLSGGVNWTVTNASYYNVAGNWDTRDGDVMTDGGKFIKSCDHVLFMQSQLLCSAEKLVSIAEAVGSVQLLPNVLVPPQATEDRHLILRLAMENIAVIAQLDQEFITGGSCPANYRGAITNPGTYSGTTYHPRFFNAGVAPLLNLPVVASGSTQADFTNGIKPRVRLWVEHHRAALLMLKDVVDRLGNDGLAAAEALRAEGGLARMWGSDPSKLTEIDNSLRAVIARQIGRLEVDSFVNNNTPPATSLQVSPYMPRGEPECIGLPSVTDYPGENDMVAFGFEATLGARAADRPPGSLGQQRAQALVERVGMTLANDKLNLARQTKGALMTMLREQLVRHDAKVMGLDWATEGAAFEAQRAAAYDSILEGLTDADVAFGVTSAVAIVAQLTERDDWPVIGSSLPSSFNRGVYHLSAMMGPALTAADGRIHSTDPSIPTGLSRTTLAYDVSGVASRSAAIVRCTGASATDTTKNAQDVYQSPADAAYALHYHLSSVFPDPAGFSLATWDPTTARRFELTRAEYAATHATDGLIRVEMEHQAAVMSAPEIWGVYLTGLFPTPAAGATNPLDDMEVALIYGQPWEADCLAGLRKVCGANFTPAKRLNLTATAPARRDSVGQYQKSWSFENGSGITYRSDGVVLQANAMMIVLLPKNGRPGRVLGTAKPRAAPTPRPERFALSAQSAAFLSKVFSGAGPDEAGDRCVESAATGLPAVSCIDGIYRDQYIPLTNELNSDGAGGDDSWKHYLNLAKEAAAQADQLGQQLMDVGLSKELRMEGAQEALANLCGELVDVTNVDFRDGTGTSLDSGALNACMAQDSVDFVFLSASPSDSSEATELIRRAKICVEGANPQLPFCTSGGAPVVSSNATIRSFEFPTAPGPDRPTGTPGCDEILGTNPGEPDPSEILLGGTTLDQALAYRWFSQSTFDLDRWALATRSATFDPVTLAGAVAKLKFKEDNAGVWQLTLNGAPLMAGSSGVAAPSAAAFASSPLRSIWPLCRQLDPSGKSGAPEQDDCNLQARRIERSFTAQGAVVPVDMQYDAKVRRSVEGALWAMARLTGYMPSGAFTKVLPAMNYSSASVGGVNAEAPAPAIFAPGTFQNVGGAYNLSGGRYDSDRRTLGDLVPLSTALRRWWRERVSQTQSHYAPYFSTEASEPTNHYLAVVAANRGRAFLEQLPSYQRSLNTYQPLETYTLDSWLDAIFSGAANYENAWLAMRWSLLNGHQPKAMELLMNGVLLSHVAMRRDNCDEGLKDGSFADLLPYIPPQVQSQDLLYVFPSIGDTHPQFWSGTTFGTPINTWNGENGYFNSTGANYSGMVVAPDCGVTGMGTSCDGGVRTWRMMSTSSDRHGLWTSDHTCDVRDSEFTADLLSPHLWPPAERVQQFIDPGPDAYSVVAMMGALACLGPQDGLATISEDIPDVKSAADIVAVRNWIDLQAAAVATYQETLFLIDVPQGVVDSVKAGRVDYAQLGQGEKGSQSLAVAAAILSTYQGFSAVYDGLRRASAALKNAELALAQIDVQKQSHLNNIAIEQIRTIANAVSDTIQVVSQSSASMLSFNPVSAIFNSGAGVAAAGNAASAAVDLVAQLAILEKVNENEQLASDLYAISTSLALATMSEEAAAALNQVNDGLKQTQTAQLEAARAQIALGNVQRNAAFALAKASGADSVDLNGDGEADAGLPVNTVYRRSYDILRRRYQGSLETAKRYAYMARLSMEQKLGVRFASLNESIGSVPPPSQWIDRLCEMTGVDYEALRTADGDNASEEELLGKFADQYVGDYVAQLEALLEFYNVRYPSQTENDAAVLSLRDDLVYGDGVCQRESSNLLYFSDDLGANSSPIGDDTQGSSLNGWRTTDCSWDASSDTGVCLDAIRAIQQPNGEWGVPYEVAPAVGANQSELAYVKPPTPGGTATILRNSETEQEPISTVVSSAPEAAVYQTVHLQKGDTYILSWRDMARKGAGGVANAMAAVQYRVMVTTDDWRPVLIEDPIARGGDDQTWSERRQVTISPSVDGNYNVVFMPSSLLDLEAVAIANVQLEAAAGVTPGPYEATTASRLSTGTSCGRGNAQMLRDAFVRRCEGDSCFYELSKPIQLVEGNFAAGRVDLPGVASNNFNYRHGSIVLNVVGTGVLDCANADASCFSQGFLEYELKHSAFNAELVDHAGEPRCFNFGAGTINHGKALAAERVLGVPLSDTDADFVASNAFEQRAFVGRPLSGRYNLRIYETPELRWEQIEDIQLYLDYSYWSRVDTQQ